MLGEREEDVYARRVAGAALRHDAVAVGEGGEAALAYKRREVWIGLCDIGDCGGDDLRAGVVRFSIGEGIAHARPGAVGADDQAEGFFALCAKVEFDFCVRVGVGGARDREEFVLILD